jgi:hypothetical protein
MAAEGVISGEPAADGEGHLRFITDLAAPVEEERSGCVYHVRFLFETVDLEEKAVAGRAKLLDGLEGVALSRGLIVSDTALELLDLGFGLVDHVADVEEGTDPLRRRTAGEDDDAYCLSVAAVVFHSCAGSEDVVDEEDGATGRVTAEGIGEGTGGGGDRLDTAEVADAGGSQLGEALEVGLR